MFGLGFGLELRLRDFILSGFIDFIICFMTFLRNVFSAQHRRPNWDVKGIK